uniref:E3 ubiquitin-protein ligase TRIM21-like n=1 Tax=Labrus bergylta TaxID=56723 RepID=A0A3Q3FPS3_9LABR
MAAANYHRSEDQFLCSICLDVFNDPVTTSCGHNFCKNCLTEHWNTSDQYNCPLCKKVFNTRPELHVNTFISEMVELQESKPGEAEIQQMIQKRQLKIQEIKHSVDFSKGDADREMAEGVQVFTALKESLVPAELKRVQQYAVDVILDPDTAHPDLILSYDGKQVHLGDVSNKVPNNPKRFSYCVNILGKQSFSSGRFYFEVQVKGKTEWDLGVAREFSKRKRTISLSPQDGFWSIWLRKRNQYEACTNPPVRLSLKCRPEKVGVFVDYEEGLVSFYNVDSAAPIYSFTDCSFRMKLLPYFSPGLNEGGRNSAPLIISPVSVK